MKSDGKLSVSGREAARKKAQRNRVETKHLSLARKPEREQENRLCDWLIKLTFETKIM
jgi:hypothetical protein